jgi:hypothetical protein
MSNETVKSELCIFDGPSYRSYMYEMLNGKKYQVDYVDSYAAYAAKHKRSDDVVGDDSNKNDERRSPTNV